MRFKPNKSNVNIPISIPDDAKNIFRKSRLLEDENVSKKNSRAPKTSLIKKTKENVKQRKAERKEKKEHGDSGFWAAWAIGELFENVFDIIVAIVDAVRD